MNKKYNVDKTATWIETDRTEYKYDATGRLKDEKCYKNQLLTRTDSYTFDDYGNRLSKTVTDSSGTEQTNYQYDKANQLLNESNTKNGTTKTFIYRYDYKGNMLTKLRSDGIPEFTYTYDGLNRMTKSVITGVNTCTYSYTANNERFTKYLLYTTYYHTSNGNIDYEMAPYVTYYWYNYMFIQDLEYYMAYDGTSARYVKNAHGDVVSMVSGAEYTYDAYGNIKTSTVNSAIRNPYGYSGEYTDKETGLQYLRARYYDPKIGRFLQRDSWLDQGPNLYSYCGADPVNFVDPSGHCYGYKDEYETFLGVYAGNYSPGIHPDYTSGNVVETYKDKFGMTWNHVQYTTAYCAKRDEHAAKYEKYFNNPGKGVMNISVNFTYKEFAAFYNLLSKQRDKLQFEWDRSSQKTITEILETLDLLFLGVGLFGYIGGPLLKTGTAAVVRKGLEAAGAIYDVVSTAIKLDKKMSYETIKQYHTLAGALYNIDKNYKYAERYRISSSITVERLIDGTIVTRGTNISIDVLQKEYNSKYRYVNISSLFFHDPMDYVNMTLLNYSTCYSTYIKSWKE